RPRPPVSGPGGLGQFRGLLIVLGLVALVVLGFVLYQVFRSDVSIYVDNGSAEPLTVSIDGREQTTVTARSFAVVHCRSGDRHVQVKKPGGEMVLDQTKHFEKPSRKSTSTYLLNPGETHRYRTYEVEYGMSFQIPNLGFDIPTGDPESWVKSKYEKV